MPFVDVRAQRIHYEDTAGAGPAVVVGLLETPVESVA